MPTYEYECPHCKADSEQFFPIVDGPSPSVVCKECGKESTRKFSTFGIQLKGGGWGGK